MSNILDTAERVLDLAEKADKVLAEYNGQMWGVPDEARDIATRWSAYTTETKHAPGEIARLAAFVRKAAKELDPANELTAGVDASHEYARGYNAALCFIRMCLDLGLPSKETAP